MAEQQNFPIEQFKELFITFLKNNFRNSKPVITAIQSDNSECDVKNTLILYADEVYELLGGEIPSFDESDYENLEDEIRDLQTEKEELEKELKRIEGIFGTTLEDEFKIQAIIEHIKDYRSWELEELLKNGKQYLKK